MHGDGLNIDLLLVPRVDALQKLASNNLKRQNQTYSELFFLNGTFLGDVKAGEVL